MHGTRANSLWTSNYVLRGHQANENARNANGSVKCNACKKISSKAKYFLSANVFFFIPFAYFLFVLFCLHSRAFNLRLPLLLVSISVVTVEMFFLKIRLNSFPLTQISGRGLKVMKTSSKSHLNRIFKSLTKYVISSPYEFFVVSKLLSKYFTTIAGANAI